MKYTKMSGYNIFLSEKIKELMEEDKIEPHKRLAEVARLWSILPEEEKAVYDTKAEERNKQREAELLIMEQPQLHVKNDSAAPGLVELKKRPRTAYNIFYTEMIALLKNDEMNWKELMNKIGLRWNMMTKEEKDKYQYLADQEYENSINPLPKNKANYVSNSKTKKSKDVKYSDSDGSDSYKRSDGYSNSDEEN
jgi:hypothetical protein